MKLNLTYGYKPSSALQRSCLITDEFVEKGKETYMTFLGTSKIVALGLKMLSKNDFTEAESTVAGYEFLEK